MAIERVYGFIADNEDLVFYNGQSVRDLTISYIFDNEDETAFDFPGYVSSFLNIFDSDERDTVVKAFTTQITRSSSVQILNLSVADMTFNPSGTYYYELGYFQSGYEVVLRYGEIVII